MLTSFELNKDFLEEIKDLISKGQDSRLAELVHNLHPADIAEIIDELGKNDAIYLYRTLESSQASDVLVELDEDSREILLQALNSKEIAESVSQDLDSDDAVDILGDLSEEKKEEVLSHIEDEEQAQDLVDLLAHDEDTAGGLMENEFIKVRLNWPVVRALKEMRKQAEELDEVYTIYVVDDEDTLQGTLSLKSLLFATGSTPIVELYTPDAISVPVTMPSEEVANLMQKYDLVVLPVVNENMQLIGRITIDDVVDVITEEAERDFQLATGLSEKVETSDGFFHMTRARLPWLVVAFLGSMMGVFVIGNFEDEISIWPQMAFFIPLIGAMGGNVGVQASAIIVQGLANNSIIDKKIGAKLFKELGVSMFNGIIIALILLSINIFYYQPVTVVVAISLVFVMSTAGILGTITPLLLNRFKVDPAVATGPFITTMNDIIGLFIYFSIGRLLFIYFN